ncbi:MAG: flagellar type III secretion system pore protein FliP [Phycisphaerae bacterium]|nr:flagellar type III secretion system pore protein FliP [Phycisphaerae bacterium]
MPAIATGDEPTTAPASEAIKLPDIEAPGGVSAAIKWVAIVTLVSLAPAIVVMVTSFTRIIVVLGLLRQALGSHQFPPNQVLFGLALLMTLVVMSPVYSLVHRDAIGPYMHGEITQASALSAGTEHVREFMKNQIKAAGNNKDVGLFLDDAAARKQDLTWGDVPTPSLIAAFAVSELKVAFTMGFRILLPFLVIDMLVASVLVSMGMLMLPPVLISLPFKLLLFVLADGWHLVIGTLMRSFV